MTSPSPVRTLPPDQVIRYLLDDLKGVEVYARFAQMWTIEEMDRYERSLHEDEEDDACGRYQNSRELYVQFSEQFPALSRHTVVVYLFSMLEDRLNEFCEAIQREFGSACTGRLGTTRSLGLYDEKKYLEKSPLGFPSSEPCWEGICVAKDTRDLLTHRLGYVNPENLGDNRAKESALTKGTGLVESFARDQLVVNDKFIANLVTDIRALGTLLLSSYEGAQRGFSASKITV